MSPFRSVIARVLAGVCVALLSACAHLPPLEGRSVSTAVSDTGNTRLGRGVEEFARGHPGLTGVMPLVRGHDAFAARATLAAAAERTLDLQYYVWHDDLSGGLLFDAVQRAADRGVRVRLLLDDNNTVGMDERLWALDAHPNIEVRLFNPFVNRGARLLDYLSDFSRVNRRMHNKSFTADNQVTVVGGRNVGDEYFSAGDHAMFIDLDMLAIGEVVNAVSRDFDRYWASDSAYPLRTLKPSPPGSGPMRQAVAAASVENYRRMIAESTFVRDLMARKLAFEWVPARMISDDPAKGLGRADDSTYLWAKLVKAVPRPTQELVLVSPYFVPTDRGADFLTGLARQGVKVSVVTNSLEATDVAVVHSGYAHWRQPLLAAGVDLHELKRAAAMPPVRERGMMGMGSSSTSSLHAKVFLVDRRHVFVGSFNFDPRSAKLNTELGFVIDSPMLTHTLAGGLASILPERTYRLRLQDGAIQWTEMLDGSELVFDSDPYTSWLLRFGVSFLSLLPLEDLL
jgi:cardiolipin synthase C